MTATPIHSVVMLFEKIPLGKLVSVQFPALLEQGIGISCLTRTTPGTGVGYHYPAFSVREILDQGCGSGKCSCPAPSLFRSRVVPSERICLLVEVLCHLGHCISRYYVFYFRTAVDGCHQTGNLGRGATPGSCT